MYPYVVFCLYFWYDCSSDLLFGKILYFFLSSSMSSLIPRAILQGNWSKLCWNNGRYREVQGVFCWEKENLRGRERAFPEGCFHCPGDAQHWREQLAAVSLHYVLLIFFALFNQRSIMFCGADNWYAYQFDWCLKKLEKRSAHWLMSDSHI